MLYFYWFFVREYAALHSFLTAMKSAFSQADRDKSGFLDSNEIHQALSGAGFQLTLPTVKTLVTKFDQSGRQQLDFERFLSMTAHLSHVRSLFAWNDPHKQGNVTFNFDSLAHLTTELL